jgi:hypothetical protein
VKYKKCCLLKDEETRAVAPPARARVVEHRRGLLAASGDPSPHVLDLAADHFERRGAGEGFAAQVMRFSQPLIEAADGDFEKIERAMTLGMIFWNIAVAREGGDESLAIALEHITKTEEDAAEFRALAASMVERHMQMLPEMHAERRKRCASTEG